MSCCLALTMTCCTYRNIGKPNAQEMLSSEPTSRVGSKKNSVRMLQGHRRVPVEPGELSHYKPYGIHAGSLLIALSVIMQEENKRKESQMHATKQEGTPPCPEGERKTYAIAGLLSWNLKYTARQVLFQQAFTAAELHTHTTGTITGAKLSKLTSFHYILVQCRLPSWVIKITEVT